MREVEAQPQQQATLQDSTGHRGVADRSKEDGVVLAQLLLDRVRQDLTGGMPPLGTQLVLGGVEGESVPGGDGGEDLEPFGNDFGPDAVTGDHGQLHSTSGHREPCLPSV